jgi:5,10-methylenetetrahydrofolate reductase
LKIADAARNHPLITVELIPDRVITKDLAFLRGRVDAITVPALQNHPEDPSYPTQFQVTPQQRSVASALIVQRNGIESVPSLTCRDFRKSDLATIPSLLRLGLDNLLILFGDPLPGTSVRKYRFAKTSDLIQDILTACETKKPCVGGVTNQYARNRENEVSRTLEKVDAGASYIITNIALDEYLVLDHVDNLRSQGLHVPILVQVSIPASLANLDFVSHKFEIPVPDSVKKTMRRKEPHVGISVAEQAYSALRESADGIHFSYLLRTRNPISVYHRLLERIGASVTTPLEIVPPSKW